MAWIIGPGLATEPRTVDYRPDFKPPHSFAEQTQAFAWSPPRRQDVAIMALNW